MAVNRSTLSPRQKIVQRSSLLLQDVHYVIEAHFEMTDKAAPSDNPGKFQDIVTRRMERGQCFHTPYFGCREFPVSFRRWPGGPIPTIDETRDLGLSCTTSTTATPPPSPPPTSAPGWNMGAEHPEL